MKWDIERRKPFDFDADDLAYFDLLQPPCSPAATGACPERSEASAPTPTSDATGRSVDVTFTGNPVYLRPLRPQDLTENTHCISSEVLVEECDDPPPGVHRRGLVISACREPGQHQEQRRDFRPVVVVEKGVTGVRINLYIVVHAG